MPAKILGSLAALVLALSTAGVAQAGFGRRGSATQSSGSHGGGSGRSSASRADVHVGSGSSSSHYERPRASHSHWHSHGGYRPQPYVYPRHHVWGYGIGYWPPPPAASDGVVVDQPTPDYGPYEARRRPAIASTLGADLTLGGRGYLLGTQLAWEGARLGFALGYTAAFAPIAGTADYDTIHLAHAHLMIALLRGERGRLRAELGPHIAAAPEVTFIAPGLGVSGFLALAGPLGLEGRVFGNVWPYTQLDARAGFALTADVIGVSFGMRAVYLNDQGVLGAVNAGDTSDSFYGPYVNLGIAL